MIFGFGRKSQPRRAVPDSAPRDETSAPARAVGSDEPDAAGSADRADDRDDTGTSVGEDQPEVADDSESGSEPASPPSPEDASGDDTAEQVDIVDEVADFDSEVGTEGDSEDDSQFGPDDDDDAAAGDDDDADDADDDDDEDEDAEPVDWREDGPFDIDEVDLEADDVDRLDFGSLILTPFEGMEVHLNVDQASSQIMAAAVIDGESAIELALFGAPRSGGFAAEVAEELVRVSAEAEAQAELHDGPFGEEVFRRVVLPPPSEGAAPMLQEQRIWLVEGPGWLLRGVVMGAAAATDRGEDADSDVLDFFRNIVVRRGAEAVAPGDVIPMTMPTDLVGAEGQA